MWGEKRGNPPTQQVLSEHPLYTNTHFGPWHTAQNELCEVPDLKVGRACGTWSQTFLRLYIAYCKPNHALPPLLSFKPPFFICKVEPTRDSGLTWFKHLAQGRDAIIWLQRAFRLALKGLTLAPLSSRSYKSYNTTPTFISSRDCMSYAGTVNTTPRASCLIVWAALTSFSHRAPPPYPPPPCRPAGFWL